MGISGGHTLSHFQRSLILALNLGCLLGLYERAMLRKDSERASECTQRVIPSQGLQPKAGPGWLAGRLSASFLPLDRK